MTTDHHIPLAGLLLATALTIGAAAVGANGSTAAAGEPRAAAPSTTIAPVVADATTSSTTTTTESAPAPTVPAPPTTAPPTTAAPAPPAPQRAPAPAPARAAAPPTTAAPPPPTAAPAPPPPTTAAPAPPPPGATRDRACEADFASWMNGARSSAGVPALATDGAIGGIPAGWSRHMADRQVLTHNPNHRDQIRSARPEANRTAENVGYSSQSGRAVFEAFMASSGHRANILHAQHSRAATGCHRDASGTTWVTVNFWG